jgi:hypothetical protein
MAGNLGTLTLDLIARIGGFTGPMDQAERRAKKNAKGIKESAEQASVAWSGLGKVAAGAFAGLSVVGLFGRFITETKAAEQEQAQLAAVLNSTSQAAGFSSDQLNSMADAMESVSMISAGEITSAQTALLAFTGVVGPEFTRAMSAAIDMAARTGGSVVSAAETIGRALDVPSKGLNALSKQGFRFTDEQKNLAKQLEATGRTAEAQGIILNALEESYGGAAAAARDTFAGALAALQNTISSLLTGEGSLESAKDAVNALNSALSSPAARLAVDALAASAVVLSAVIASRLVGSVTASAVAFAFAQREAVRYQLALAAMAGISSRAAIGITAVGVAARGAGAAMALLGGPVGVAFLAASALIYFATSAGGAKDESADLRKEVDFLNTSLDGLTKGQAGAALLDIQQQLNDAQFRALDAGDAVNKFERLLKSLPNDSRVREWTDSLIRARGEFDSAGKVVDALRMKIEQLNNIVSAAPSIASEEYTKLSAKIAEQLLLVGKKTEGDKLAARISAGLVEGLLDGEGDLLVAAQRRLDAASAAVDAENKRKAAAESAGKAAAQRSAAEKKAIEDNVKSLQFQAETLGMSADAVTLLKLKLDGATESQLMMGKAALDTVAAFEAQKEAIDAMNDAQEKTNTEAVSILDSLMTEEESVRQSYARRRQIILDNTLITGQAQTDLLRKLEEKRNEDLLAINGTFWEKYLIAAEKSLGSFDELAESVIDNFSGKFGDAFEAMIFDADTLEGSIASMAESMARSVVNALGQMAAQWLAYQAVQLLVGKTTQQAGASALGSNASASAISAGINAFSSTAAIPIVGPAAAPAAMAAALAVTVPMAAAVQGLAMAGMAHDGIDSVPQTGTWLLEKGERVTTAETSAKLDATLAQIQAGMMAMNSRGGNERGGTQVNMTINTPDANSFRASRRQVGSAVRRGVS